MVAMRKLASLLLLALLASAQADKFCFVVAGDGRSDSKLNRPEDKNGINVVITSEIAQAVLSEKARFLLWTGDLAVGYAKDPAVFESQLMDWRTIMTPLYVAGVKVLPCRGNHDMSSTDAEKVWHKVFSGPYALPGNGPHGEKNLSFFHEEGPVLAIGLDQYQAGAMETVDQEWLDSVLKSHKKPFVFAIGHEPAFMDGAHADTMDADAAKRDTFVQALIRAGGRTFFAGHDHLYDHMIVKSGNGRGPEFHQFVAGTSGAPFYTPGEYKGNNTGWSLTRAKNIPQTYGYLLVEIDGKKCTITFKGRVAPGRYEAMDSWSYMR